MTERLTQSCVLLLVSGLVVVITLGLASQSIAGTIFYSNDFEGAVGPGWNSSSVNITPVGGRHFLGEFGNNTVSLDLSGLPDHTQTTVSFDLYAIRTWDGNETRMDWGPDRWKLAVDGGPTLLDTTFSNDHPNSREYGQAFPGNYPGGQYAPRTGAAEINTLGYTYMYGSQPGGPMDSVYRLSYTFQHNSDSLGLNFSASNLQSLGDESWGLDNVVVSTDATSPPPRPSRTVQFSGRTWNVRYAAAPQPPPSAAPNFWNDAPDSVWVDGAGLHLKIRKVDGQWHCAEVNLPSSLGYGTYTFDLASNTEAFDPQTVLGMFLYQNGQHELDVEITKSFWGQNSGRWTAQYAVQPGYSDPFHLAPTDDETTHTITWAPDKITFLSRQGSAADNGVVIYGTEYTGANIPSRNAAVAVINFWLNNEYLAQTTSLAYDEVVIRNFNWTPLIPGDANGDGQVGFADYQILETHFGIGATNSLGDFNGDGQVGFADYQIMEAHFAQSIPEPATLSALSLGGLALIRRRRN